MKKREETYHMTKKEMVRLKVAARIIEKLMKVENTHQKESVNNFV